MLQFECQKNKTYIEGSTSSTSVKQGINQSIRLFLNNDCLHVLGYKGDNGGLGHFVKHRRQVAKWPVPTAHFYGLLPFVAVRPSKCFGRPGRTIDHTAANRLRELEDVLEQGG